jgi:hypothetical protein
MFIKSGLPEEPKLNIRMCVDVLAYRSHKPYVQLSMRDDCYANLGPSKHQKDVVLETPDGGDASEKHDEGDISEQSDVRDASKAPDEGDASKTPDEGDDQEAHYEGIAPEPPDEGMLPRHLRRGRIPRHMWGDVS